MRLLSFTFCTIALLLMPTSAVGADTPGENRYNVLFIAVDDLRPELGCYGIAEAQSPRLDRFAESAVLFERHYVQVATCGASRYALLTGRSPANSGVTRNNNALYKLATEQQPGAQSLPELFRRSGYHTVCIGKISHTPDGRIFEYNGKGDGRAELPHAWHELPTPFGPWKRGWGTFFAYADGKHREDGQGHSQLMEFVAKEDDDLPDGMMASEAITKLQQLAQRDEPFFMGLGFFKPHLPFVAPLQDWLAVENLDIPLPPQGKIDSPHWHGSGEFFRYKNPFGSRPLDADAQLQARRGYYACVRYVDRQIGRVLDALEELELTDDTIVVVWGDHGWHLGEQQIWGKHSPFERANHSPLLIRVPGVSKPGLKTAALAETIDLYPTLVELCQPTFQQTRWPLDGKSLAPVLTGEQEQVREAAVSFWGGAVSVRTPTHRLIVSGKNVELYDHSEQLDAMRNIAPEAPDIVKQLRQYLPGAKRK